MPDRSSGRDHIWRILRTVIDRLDPARLVSDAVSLKDDVLLVEGISEPIALRGRLAIIAIGKASIPMATGALSVLGPRVCEALAVAKHGLKVEVDVPDALEVLWSDHPVPSESSLNAGVRIRTLVQELDENDVVLMLLSGGASALVEDLVEGVSLDDLQSTTNALLRAGCTINELNAVRRKLSRLKGGKLASEIAPARVVNIIVSDVLGNPLQDIASGPTAVPFESDGLLDTLLVRRDLREQLPVSVRAALEAGEHAGSANIDNILGTSIVADAVFAARVAAETARECGYDVQTLGFDFQGESREFGRMLGTIVRHARQVESAFPVPVALIGAGELTVTVKGSGSGGRNTEMALAAAREIDGLHGVTIASFATDGDDGSSGFAGAIVDGATISQVRSLGIDFEARMNDNDTARVCLEVDADIDIGPTGTNVNDLYLALIDEPDSSPPVG